MTSSRFFAKWRKRVEKGTTFSRIVRDTSDEIRAICAILMFKVTSFIKRKWRLFPFFLLPLAVQINFPPTEIVSKSQFRKGPSKAFRGFSEHAFRMRELRKTIFFRSVRPLFRHRGDHLNNFLTGSVAYLVGREWKFADKNEGQKELVKGD